ncbi:ATP-binding protein [Streptomyces sp. NPDC005426]|uniref:ATP-binding protein n=1 Tax=Streptomyces sp. NPDC005426 TaxID=3155344 RepID=UPI0033B18FD0
MSRALAIASNAPFSEWKHTYSDPRLCTAVVDRVTFNAHIMETGTESCGSPRPSAGGAAAV